VEYCVIGRVIPDISKDHSAFIFRVQKWLDFLILRSRHCVCKWAYFIEINERLFHACFSLPFVTEAHFMFDIMVVLVSEMLNLKYLVLILLYIVFPFLSPVSWRHSERSNSRWCAASHTVGRWINSGWKVNVICSCQALIPSLCDRSFLVKVLAGQDFPLSFMKLRVHYGVYENPSLNLVLNLCKLFVINPFVPELNIVGTPKKMRI
jgi:hypothetical protein